MQAQTKERGSLAYVLGIMFLLCAPSATMLAISHITDDNSFRPYSGSSEMEDLTLVPANDGPVVVARIGWPEGVADDPRAFAMRVKRSFQAKGVPAVVHMTSSGGSGHITYELDSNSIGPFSLQNAAAGIKATVSAYRIHPFSRSQPEVR